MNKDRYENLYWFDALEAAAHKDPSWEKPAPKREAKPFCLIEKIIGWLK